MPTEALPAHIAVCKFSERPPLYRQAQALARQGIEIDRSTLADWMGKVAFHLRPIVARMAKPIKGAGKLFADEATLPALNPGAGKTKTGCLWGDGPGRSPPGAARRPQRSSSPMPPAETALTPRTGCGASKASCRSMAAKAMTASPMAGAPREAH